MSAAPAVVPAVDSALLLRRALEGGMRVGRDGVLVVPASRLEQRRAPATLATGIAALDELTGGIPRGALTEICGPASSGRTSVLLSLMARMTQAREVCALVDTTDSFHPHSAAAAGVDLKRVLWVRCSDSRKVKSEICNLQSNKHIGDSKLCKFQITNYPSSVNAYSRRRASLSRVEQALKATDLLLQGGGFGLLVVDLADVAPDAARRVPLTSWFRFRRAVEHTPTALLVIEEEAFAKSAAGLVLKMKSTVAGRRSSVAGRQPL